MTDEPKREQIYYEGGTRDRHWLAPAGLSLSDALKQRTSRLYKTRWGAQQRAASSGRAKDRDG